MRLARAVWGFATGVAAAVATSACSSDNFASAAKVDSVRLLASQVDLPFAREGETVTIRVLAVDGRASPIVPMAIYWMPAPCVDPSGDDYFACFAAYDPSSNGARSGPGGIPLTAGLDLTPFLAAGDSFSFAMPGGVIGSHPVVAGTRYRYGLAVAFVVACAGHVEIVRRDPGNPQASPIACVNAEHVPVAPSDYAIGFVRVYAYESLRNQNPVIDHVSYGGAAIRAPAGITAPRCTAGSENDCPKTDLDAVVPASSDEMNPLDVDPSGNPRREQIWVDYYTTGGQFGDDGRVLYDPIQGKLSSTATSFQASQQAGNATLWAVVHDNRGGTDWQSVPVVTR
jgi:hypothetical protein